MTVETARGPAEVPLNPQSVIVYDVTAIDTLDALGIVPAGVIDRLFIGYLDDVAGTAEVVGTIFEPDFEAVNAIQPDLIVIGGRSSEQLDALLQLASTIDMTIPGDDLVGAALARLDAYGAIFGKDAEADALAADFDARLDKAKQAVAGKGTGLIVMTNGPKVSAYVAGGGIQSLSRTHDQLIEGFGAAPDA